MADSVVHVGEMDGSVFLFHDDVSAD